MPINASTEPTVFLRHLLQSLGAGRDESGRAQMLTEILTQSRFCLQTGRRRSPQNEDVEDYALSFGVSGDQFIWLDADDRFRETIRAAVKNIVAKRPIPVISVYFKPVPGTAGLNNCFFKTDNTIEHDELRFRSLGEVAIYDELKSRNVLFFPNPAAVLGTERARYGIKVQKREPDFLICYQGKWGILEVCGTVFHSGQVRTAADHDRARLFNHYGLFFVQSFDDARCKGNPAGVVEEFLKLLANHR